MFGSFEMKECSYSRGVEETILLLAKEYDASVAVMYSSRKKNARKYYFKECGYMALPSHRE